jgi:hypothetical protein
MLRPLVDAAQERAGERGGRALDEAIGAARAALDRAPAEAGELQPGEGRFTTPAR